VPDPIELYLDEVMTHARLGPADQKAIRAELKEHLRQLTSISDSQTPTEVYAMLENEFGNPADIGKGIASAKGRLRSYLKRKGRRTAVALAVTLLVAFSVRWAVAEEYYITSDSVAPALPRGSRCLVYKLTNSFQPGDVIVYQPDAAVKNHYVGIVQQTGDPEMLTVIRHGNQSERVARSHVIGRVILNTR
jgi:hypothetical protein